MMACRNRYLSLDPEDFDFVECEKFSKPDNTPRIKNTTLSVVNEEGETSKEESDIFLESIENENFEDDSDDDLYGPLSDEEDAQKYRPAKFEIDEWRQAVDALSSRALKYDGVWFGDMDPVPLVDSLDPLPYTCFNCWRTDHFVNACPEPTNVQHCSNCGRLGETVYTCPRCSRSQRRLSAKFGRDWRKWAPNKSKQRSDEATLRVETKVQSPGEAETLRPVGLRNGGPVKKSTTVREGYFKNEKPEVFSNDGQLRKSIIVYEGNLKNENPEIFSNDGQLKKSIVVREGNFKNEKPEVFSNDEQVDREFPGGHESRVEKRNVASCQPDSRTIRNEKYEPVKIEEQRIDRNFPQITEKRKVSSNTVQRSRGFEPYSESPQEEYDAVKKERVIRVDYPQRDEVKTEKRDVGVQTPRYFSSYFRSPKDDYGAVRRELKDYLPKDAEARSAERREADEKNKISREEYATSIRGRVMTSKPVVSTQNIQCDIKYEKSKVPEIDCQIVTDRPRVSIKNSESDIKSEKQEMRDNNGRSYNSNKYCRENWREAGEESPRRSNPFQQRYLRQRSPQGTYFNGKKSNEATDYGLRRYAPTEIQKVEYSGAYTEMREIRKIEYSGAYTEWPENGVKKCRPVEKSTALRSVERARESEHGDFQSRKLFDRPEVPDVKRTNIFSNLGKQEKSVKLTIDDSDLNARYRSNENFERFRIGNEVEINANVADYFRSIRHWERENTCRKIV